MTIRLVYRLRQSVSISKQLFVQMPRKALRFAWGVCPSDSTGAEGELPREINVLINLCSSASICGLFYPFTNGRFAHGVEAAGNQHHVTRPGLVNRLPDGVGNRGDYLDR